MGEELKPVDREGIYLSVDIETFLDENRVPEEMNVSNDNRKVMDRLERLDNKYVFVKEDTAFVKLSEPNYEDLSDPLQAFENMKDYEEKSDSNQLSDGQRKITSY